MQLSVVIPCYNGEETLGEQLEALSSQSWEGSWEVVLADNGSTDGSRQVAEAYRDRLPGMRIVDASARRGQPYALNVGAKQARGESVVFVDADDVVAAGWVAAVGRALQEHDFVASRHDVRNLNPDWLIESRGAAQVDSLQVIWYPPYLPHAGGCGLGVRRNLLELHGDFDESLPYLHDTDLCFRLQQAGVELVLIPNAVVHIRFRHGWKGLFKQARRWAEYNDLVYKRHRPHDLRIPRPWEKYWKGWRRIARRLPEIRDRQGRYALLWQAGWQLGLLTGSIRYRVAPAVFVPPRQRPSSRMGPAALLAGEESA